jgi:uncharacterized membrane protein YqjE
MCGDLLTQNTGKEVDDANLEGGDSTFNKDLHNQIIKIIEKQNELLEKNHKLPDILNKIMLGFSGLTLICALSSANIASLQFDEGTSQALTSSLILGLTYLLIFIGIIILSIFIFMNLSREKEKNSSNHFSISYFLFVCVVVLGIGLSLTLTILYHLIHNIVPITIAIRSFVFFFMFGSI